ncbi:hemerythrin domain-containing protein [Actinacidiphila glaucinigra]|uniref:hemerythrin domain-containing protein n=1 Tax=Actinacidiphila glaucinigra TaxID=235986 RepID=UPI002DD9A27E|nr:hemerythrin domain-containing protein [Actinacidiphila glaucinigra]WSD57728.1 hemerythrin domain-containing protein [Actinacidiphila glaucinigra]
MPNAHGRADIRDMLVVHEAFRRAYDKMPDLVLGVTPGDTKRALVVADHIQMIEEFLHLHHKGEDVLLWPKITARAPQGLAPALALMEEHHTEIDGLIVESSASLARWRSDANASDRDQLAAVLRTLGKKLTEHLAVEEAEILPIVDQYLTATEWHELGDHAIKSLPKNKLPIIFGMLASLADPAVVTLMLSTAPLVPRIIMPIVGPRAFAAHARKVYGTAGF